MRSNPSFLLLLLCLGALGVWGLKTILVNEESPLIPESDFVQERATADSGSPTAFEATLAKNLANSVSKTTQKTGANILTQLGESELDRHFEIVEQNLANHRPQAAAAYIQNLYSQLSSDELGSFKRLFLRQASRHSQDSEREPLKQVYLAAADLFDDIELWQNAALIAELQKDWPGALAAMRKSTALESRPDKLEEKLLKLLKYASHVRAYQETLGDELGIRTLYLGLYNEHPNYPRFQLELAQSHLRLGDVAAAQPLLKVLQYDPDLGAIARQILVKHETQAALDAPVVAALDADRRPSDILVPLQRLGTGFGVASSIDGRSVTMLLDTGASISALSKDLIERLGLPATGQIIRLTTANGVATARLFRAKNVRLGRMYVEEAVIAEIDLERNARFQGLLGTDLLNKADPDYSYLIDNTKGALIFRRK